MGKILVDKISNILLNVLPVERRFDSEGDLAIHFRVRDMYVRKRYDLSPLSEEEADAKGMRTFNGLASSLPRLQFYPDGTKTIVAGDIAPTRYLIGEAMRDVLKAGDYNEEEYRLMSPLMANISLLVPVRMGGEYYLVSQIKGKALGSGEILAAPIAGNVEAVYLAHQDPLVEALRNECAEEIGLDLSCLNSSSFVCAFEDGTGGVNFVSVARDADLNQILHSYDALARKKLSNNEELELQALSLLRIKGLDVHHEGKNMSVDDVLCYFPSPTGLQEKVETRVVRPYTEAVLEYVQDESNVRFLMERAGL